MGEHSIHLALNEKAQGGNLNQVLFSHALEASIPMTEPPIQTVLQERFHTDANLSNEPSRRVHQQTARRIAFRALTSGRLAAQLIHVFRFADGPVGRSGVGSWLIADPAGNVTAHRGQIIGPGGPWELANAIVPGSVHAVQAPALNGYFRDRPQAYRESVANHQASLQCLRTRQEEAIEAGNRYATMHIHAEPGFVPLLSAAVEDRSTQLILHDWLAERGFPHVNELRSKRWNQGKWTENQLLDLLSKPFMTTRRSFLGRTV